MLLAAVAENLATAVWALPVLRPKLSRRQETVDRALARIRARGERAIATLKT